MAAAATILQHPKYIKLQGICYTYQRHLLYLPDWIIVIVTFSSILKS